MTEKIKLSQFRYKDEQASIESIQKLDSMVLSENVKADIAKQLYFKTQLKYKNAVSESKKAEYYKASCNFLSYIHRVEEVVFLEENNFAFLKFLHRKKQPMDPRIAHICENLNSLLTDDSKQNYINLIELRENVEEFPEKYDNAQILIDVLEEYISVEKEYLHEEVEIDETPQDINEEFEFHMFELNEAKMKGKKKGSKSEDSESTGRKIKGKKTEKKAEKGEAKPKKKRKSYKDDPDYEEPSYKSVKHSDDDFSGPYGAPTKRFMAKGDVKARFKKDYGKDFDRVYYAVAHKIFGNWKGRGKTELPRSKWTRDKRGVYHSKKSKREDVTKAGSSKSPKKSK